MALIEFTRVTTLYAASVQFISTVEVMRESYFNLRRGGAHIINIVMRRDAFSLITNRA